MVFYKAQACPVAVLFFLFFSTGENKMEIIRKPGGRECLGTRGNMETPGRILRDLQRHRKGMRKKWKHMETQLERVDIARGKQN